MKKRILALLLALTLIFSMTGCGSIFQPDEQEDAPEPDDSVIERPPEYPVRAFNISVDSRPQRVVSLSPSVTDKLFEMGFGDRLLGVSDSCDNADGRRRCGTVQEPDLEAVESLSPQLLLADTGLPQDALDRMRELGIKVALVEKVQTMKQLKQVYITLAQVFDGMRTGEVLGTSYFEQNIERKLNELADKAQEPARYGVFVRALDYTVATGDTLEGELLGVIGLLNAAADFTDWTVPEDAANGEEVREKFRAIEFIYMDRNDMTIKDMEQSAYWRGLNAVLQDRYLYIDRTLFDRQSFGMLEELDRMQQYANGEIESSKHVDYPPEAPAPEPAPAPAQEPAQQPAPPPEPAPEPEPEPEPPPEEEEPEPPEEDDGYDDGYYDDDSYYDEDDFRPPSNTPVGELDV